MPSIERVRTGRCADGLRVGTDVGLEELVTHPEPGCSRGSGRSV
jgi:hypothetical protein